MGNELFEKILYSDVHFVIRNALRYDRGNEKFSCFGSPKKCHHLCLLVGLSAKYRSKSGEIFTASPGDVIYTKESSEYEVEFFKESECSQNVGVNFSVLNPPEIDADDVIVFRKPKSETLRLFEKAEEEEKNFAPNLVKNTTLTKLIVSLIQRDGAQLTTDSDLIRPGVDLLLSDLCHPASVREAADACHVCEVYFRKLFYEKYAMTPVKYRNLRRIEQAKGYLMYSDLSVSEIAERLGFSDSAHFIRTFAAEVKETPHQYRQREESGTD